MGDQPEIWKAVAMADHFDKMQKLKDPVAGVPNFRRVPGYKVNIYFIRFYCRNLGLYIRFSVN